MRVALIQFTCTKPGCGAVVEEEVYLSEPNLMAERMTDGDVFEEHDMACPECGTDYEVETVSGMGGISATLDGEDVSVEETYEHELDDYDEFLSRYEPANNTIGAYEQARGELLKLIAMNGADSASILNRMVYSQFIAAMEAYLSDKLLRLATDHPEIKRRIVTKADFLDGKTLKLSDILLDPNQAEITFKVGLQQILYHDLKKVEKLYRIALAGPFFPPDPAVKTDLERAIMVRHDCVHRNGADLNGTTHQFDEATIRSLADQVSALVDHLEGQAEKSVVALSNAANPQPQAGTPSG